MLGDRARDACWWSSPALEHSWGMALIVLASEAELRRGSWQGQWTPS